MSKDAGAKLGEFIAQSSSKPKGTSMSFGTVQSVGSDGKLSVTVDGGTLEGVPMLTGCEGVSEGDRVVLMTYGHLSVVMGVLAGSDYAKLLVDIASTSSTGGWYMGETQSITLPEPISAQRNGILLQWSYYYPDDGTSGNFAWHYQVVPKAHAWQNSSGGVSEIFAAGDTRLIYKYLYITDTKISGAARNSSSSWSFQGLKLDNRYAVLQRIFGF